MGHMYELFKLGVLSPFPADLKHRMRGDWRDARLVDSNMYSSILAHLSFLVNHPFFYNECVPNTVPHYLHLDLSKHVMHSVSRLRLRAHTLRVWKRK